LNVFRAPEFRHDAVEAARRGSCQCDFVFHCGGTIRVPPLPGRTTQLGD
jgi:hypothetical protein